MARDTLELDPDNADAKTFLAAAERSLGNTASTINAGLNPQTEPPSSPSIQPTTFAYGRYEVTRFLGKGGKKKVYLAHDNLLDRDVAFALIKTEGLDDTSRERISRKAQAMNHERNL